MVQASKISMFSRKSWENGGRQSVLGGGVSGGGVVGGGEKKNRLPF